MSRARKPTSATVIDAALSTYWQQTTTNCATFEVGLLVGHVGVGPVDALLTAVRVPSESEDGETVRDFNDVSVEWVQEFAKQIDRLLPGGISVAGLYVVSPAASRTVFDDTTLYVRAVAETLALPEPFRSIATTETSSTTHYVVHVCPHSTKTTAQRLRDVIDVSKTVVSPVELKTSAASLELQQFTATIAIDESIAFPRELFLLTPAASNDRIERIVQTFETQLVPLATRVAGALAVPTKRQRSDASYELQFLISASSCPTSSKRIDTETPPTTLGGSFRGAIRCNAFVLAIDGARETAAQQLKRDFVKSLLLRAELVVERWTAVDSDSDSDDRSMFSCSGGCAIAFPARATLRWTSAIGTCDYFPVLLHVFEGEHALAVQNALEILGALEDDDSDGAVVTAAAASLELLESEAQVASDGSNSSGPPVTPATNVTAESVGSASNTSNSVMTSAAVLVAVLLALLAVLLRK